MGERIDSGAFRTYRLTLVRVFSCRSDLFFVDHTEYKSLSVCSYFLNIIRLTTFHCFQRNIVLVCCSFCSAYLIRDCLARFASLFNASKTT